MNMATEDTTDEATAVSRDLHEVLDELDAQNPMSDIGRALLVRRVGGMPRLTTRRRRELSAWSCCTRTAFPMRASKSAQRIGPANPQAPGLYRVYVIIAGEYRLMSPALLTVVS